MTVLLVTAVAVGLLYLLRPPARLVTVPSTLLWRRLVERSAKRRRWLRWLLSLLLSLLVALLLTSVLFRIEPRTGSVREPTLLIDNTASMGSRSGDGTRLDWARRHAADLLERSTGRITVADLAGTYGPQTFASVEEARRALAEIRWQPDAVPAIPSTLAPPTDAEGPIPIFLLSDDPAVLDHLELPPGTDRSRLEVVSVGVPSTNVGILRFGPDRDTDRDGTRSLGERTSSAFLEILNGGDGPVTARLTVTVQPTDDLLEDPDPSGLEPLLRRDLEIGPGRTWTGVLELERARRVAPTSELALRADVTVLTGGEPTEDDQPLDDVAWTVVEPGSSAVRWNEPGSAGWPPAWLQRVIATSDTLTASGPRSGAVTVVPTGATADAPCMEMFAMPEGEAEGASLLEPDEVRLELPDTSPVPLPWTAVAVASANPGTEAGTTAWMLALTDDGALRPLVLAPGPESPCVRWLFDPVPTGLVTRAELPTVVDDVLTVTAREHRRAMLAETLGGERRVLVDGAWRPHPAEGTADGRPRLRVGPDGFDALSPPGRNVTDIATAPETSGETPSVSAGQGPLRWPGRTALLMIVATLILAETLSRFAGWTE